MENIRSRARQQLTSVMLTLLSIVQAIALESFWSNALELNLNLSPTLPNVTAWLLCIITLLLIVGIPHFNFANTELDDRRFDEAVERLKQKKQEVELVAKQYVEEMTEPEVADMSEPIASEPMVGEWPARAAQSFVRMG